MKLRDEIYAETIKSYIDNARENKLKISLAAEVQEGSEISKLPKEAYVNGFLYMTFDFGSEQTWVVDQIEIKDKMFNCVLVYTGTDGWEEFPVSFPCIFIIGIDSPEIDSGRTVNFSITKEDKEFEVKVNNSKKHLKLVKSWDVDASN